MAMRSVVVLLFAFGSHVLFAQDTVRVRLPDDDRFCVLTLCIRNECVMDSLPLSFLTKDAKLELRINDKCNAKKRTDVFVSSFEIAVVQPGGMLKTAAAPGSFFTGAQLKMMRSLKKGDSFTIKNVAVHGPDAFRKIEDLQIILK